MVQSSRRVGSKTLLGAVLVPRTAGVAESGCSSSSPKSGVTRVCKLNSDCSAFPGVHLRLCHAACRTSADCDAGARCVQARGRFEGVPARGRAALHVHVGLP